MTKSVPRYSFIPLAFAEPVVKVLCPKRSLIFNLHEFTSVTNATALNSSPSDLVLLEILFSDVDLSCRSPTTISSTSSFSFDWTAVANFEGNGADLGNARKRYRVKSRWWEVRCSWNERKADDVMRRWKRYGGEQRVQYTKSKVTNKRNSWLREFSFTIELSGRIGLKVCALGPAQTVGWCHVSLACTKLFSSFIIWIKVCQEKKKNNVFDN